MYCQDFSNGSTLVARYDIHGLPVTVRGDAPELMEVVCRLIGCFALPDGSERHNERALRVVIRLGSPGEFRDDAMRRMRCFWAGRLAGGLDMEYRTAERLRVVDLPGRCRMWLDLAARQAEIVVSSGNEWAMAEGCLIILLTESLGAAGQHVVHAACLAGAGRNPAPGVLVAGPSGTGKTTTALSLSRGGMTLLTDDATFVTPHGTGSPLTAWGLPTPCKVLRRTLELLAWLDELPLGPGRQEGEYTVQAATAESALITVTPSVLLLLEPPNAAEHRIIATDKLVAVTTLTRENVRAYEPAAASPGGRAFRAIASLVAQCRAFRLSAGPDMSSLPKMVAELVS